MKKLVEELSHRERILLYVLMCFLIVVCGWFFVITTSIDSYNAACSEYDTVISQKTDKEKVLQSYLLAPESLATKKDSYTKIIDKYNPILKNEKIDKLITTAILSQGLKPVSLEISNSNTNSSNTSTSDTKTDSNATADSKANTEQATNNEANTSSNESIKQVNVNVTLNGSFEKISNLVSYLSKLKGISISKLQYTESTSPASASSGSNVSMTIIVYMIDK